MVKKISILGTKMSVVNWGNVIFEIEEILRKKKQIFITTPNPEHIVEAFENKTFQNIINESDLAVPDGMGLVWAIRRRGNQKSEFRIQKEEKEKQNFQFSHQLSGQAIFNFHKKNKSKNKLQVERVTGVDLMEKLCGMAQDKKWKVGLLGGKNGVGEKTLEKIKEKYKDLDIEFVGSHRDVLNRSEKQDKEIIQKIEKNQIDVLFVAYGAYKQELIISEYIKLLPKVKIFMGVGGAFDFFAGKLKRAPKWMQTIGFEWMFRLIQEPSRWKRQLKLVKFLYLTNRESKRNGRVAYTNIN